MSFEILKSTLEWMENKIFHHARLKQIETVESFLAVAVNKSKLMDKIVLMADWNNETLAANIIHIVISPQNEIPNMQIVEELFEFLSKKKFKYIRFLKYIEYRGLHSEITSFTVSNLVVELKHLSYLVSKDVPDKYDRAIKIVVFVEPCVNIDAILQPFGDHWVPDKNLLYVLDMLIGEYYMTKHISTISFAPRAVVKVETIKSDEVKDYIDELLRIKTKKCAKCKTPEYRTILNKDHCPYCM